jgi:hypothetical protein
MCCFPPLYRVAVESARMVTSKAQLWRFIGEIGLSPLLAGLQKSLERQVTPRYMPCPSRLSHGSSA